MSSEPTAGSAAEASHRVPGDPLMTLNDASEPASPAVAWDRPPPTERRRPSLTMLATIVTAIAVAGLAATAVLEGRGGARAAVPLDTAVDESGLALRGAVDWSLPSGLTPWLLLLAFVGLGFLVVRGRAVLVRVVALVGAAALVAAALAVWTVQPVTVDFEDRLWGDGVGHTSGPSEGLHRFSTYALAPGEPATFGFAIDNTGFLPISILGYADEPVEGDSRTFDLGARVVGLGWIAAPAPEPGAPKANLADATVAWPRRLVPGERLILAVLARGGPCAAGSKQEPESSSFISRVRVVYRVAGWTRVATVGLPVIVAVPTLVGPCPMELIPAP